MKTMYVARRRWPIRIFPIKVRHETKAFITIHEDAGHYCESPVLPAGSRIKKIQAYMAICNTWQEAKEELVRHFQGIETEVRDQLAKATARLEAAQSLEQS
jgi:hypothetical protein